MFNKNLIKRIKTLEKENEENKKEIKILRENYLRLTYIDKPLSYFSEEMRLYGGVYIGYRKFDIDYLIDILNSKHGLKSYKPFRFGETFTGYENCKPVYYYSLIYDPIDCDTCGNKKISNNKKGSK
jgi:hypothetical protein